MYACKTWLTTLEDERKLVIVERKICGPIINNLTHRYEISSNKEIYTFGELNVIGVIRTIRLSWVARSHSKV